MHKHARIALAAAAASLSLTQVEEVLAQTRGRVHSTIARMQPERLAAAHADVERIKANVIAPEALPFQPALTDYRAIFHAHAEDSTHTGGTRDEMLAEAKTVGVEVIFLSDHYRPPRDFMDSWRGIHDDVLFIPGSEMHGFLLHPDASVVPFMSGDKQALIAEVGKGSGMLFLSHVEERRDHPMDGLTGMEVYNRHADAKDDMMSLMAIYRSATNPEGLASLHEALERYPHEMFAAQLDYSDIYMGKWDEESVKQRVVGVAANDCHHNQVIIVKKVDDTTALLGTIVDPDDGMRKIDTAGTQGLAELLEGHAPGEIVASVDFDPYARSMMNVNTHIFAAEKAEPVIRAAVAAGHAYVAHEWMCPTPGFYYHVVKDGESIAMMGDEVTLAEGQVLTAQFPSNCVMRLLKNGEEILLQEGNLLELPLAEPGVYRLEGWLKVDGEERIWIYANPIYVR